MGRAGRGWQRHHDEGPADGQQARKILTHPAVVLLLLSLLAVLCYAHTFSAPFLFDDDRNIVDNPAIRHLWKALDLSGSRYIGYLSFALNYRFGGLDPFGYHLVNLLIHVANGFLVYWLILLLCEAVRQLRPPTPFHGATSAGPWIALSAACLFVVHPIQTQAVTYIVQRFASLVTLFYLLAVVCYVKWRLIRHGEEVGRPRRAAPLWYAGALVCTVLAMKTKENGFTLPVLLLLVEAVFFRPFIGLRWRAFLPFLLTLLIVPLTHLWSIGAEGGFARDTIKIGRWDYFFTQCRVLMTYLRLLIVPVHQTLDYDYPIYRSLFAPPVFASALVLAVLIGAAGTLLRRAMRNPASVDPRRLFIVFGVWWFFLTIAVESSLIPIDDVIYEHRVYLPSIGFFLAVGALAAWVWSRRRWLRVPLVLAALLIVSGLSGAAYRRNAVWRDAVTLWEDVVRKAPRKGRGHNNLAKAYQGAGRMAEATKEIEVALTLQPENPYAHNNLGLSYREQGRVDEAIEEIRAAVILKPDYAEAHFNLAIALAEKGRVDEAIQAYRSAIALRADYAETYHVNLLERASPGFAAALTRRPDTAAAPTLPADAATTRRRAEEAVRKYQAAVEVAPEESRAYNGLGDGYLQLGRLADAIAAFQTAVRLDPTSADGYNNLGSVYMLQERFDEALAAFETALRLKPDLTGIHYNLGNAYAAKKRLDEAAAQYRLAIKAQANDVRAYNNLGNVYILQGKLDEAMRQYQAALRIKPDFVEARNNLRYVYTQQGRAAEEGSN
ncbi:MAG: tetratricopeptide repeat protein [Deltaproteobacteria bacterium]|nr:tetratricopeptide repeat protein [Deltaproteobacteria bacterium]